MFDEAACGFLLITHKRKANLMLPVFSRNLNMPPPSRLVNLLVENRSLYATYGKRYGQFVDNPHVDKYGHLYRYYLDII